MARAGDPDAAGELIAQLLIEDGQLTPEQLRYAARVRSKMSSPPSLLSVLQQLHLVEPAQIRRTLVAHPRRVPVGALLVQLDLITRDDLRYAVGLQQDQADKPLGRILVENHLISEAMLVDVLSLQLGCPNLDKDVEEIDEELARRVSPDWLRRHEMVPVRAEGGVVLLALGDPTDRTRIDAARRVFGPRIRPGIARRESILAAIARLEEPKLEMPGETESEGAVVGMLNALVAEAIHEGVSDIHIEPLKDRLRVRFREDGVLVPHADYPLKVAPALLGRLKVLAGADIAERRRHQDGRMLFEHGGRQVDMRVSIYVTIHGEKAVIRLLNTGNRMLDITELGLAPRIARRFREDVLDVPSGVVLVTGPTGSGKTTTLYSAVNYLNNINTSIITAEDPVEYVIDGISQCSINPKINITFEETLRHIVRQDPDVIVIGEIRDRFSAETAIQAALTGHKVLTTFHTEDSIGGLLRLLNMDIEAFLISSTVVCVVAQRLVRRVCPECAEEHRLTPDEIRRLGYDPLAVQDLVFPRAVGCPRCHHRGYRGRVAVFEMLILNEKVKDALIARKTSYEIRRISLESTGMVTLLEDGITKAARGETTFEEIIRNLPRLSPPRQLAELRRLQGDVG
ncbi:MAG: type II/IV secretion system protein [Acidobacteria bacterium]|nr:MAG: type II/IV secretion system protein [Acidobacteriota bacterium]